jgi:hypothetical protein
METTMHSIDRTVEHTIDEKWMPEWLCRGYRQITEYLSKYDAYLAYCAEHGLEP